jgi:hypothetical protein
MTLHDKPLTASTVLLAIGLGLIGWAGIIAAGRALVALATSRWWL